MLAEERERARKEEDAKAWEEYTAKLMAAEKERIRTKAAAEEMEKRFKQEAAEKQRKHDEELAFLRQESVRKAQNLLKISNQRQSERSSRSRIEPPVVAPVVQPAPPMSPRSIRAAYLATLPSCSPPFDPLERRSKPQTSMETMLRTNLPSHHRLLILDTNFIITVGTLIY